MKQFFLTIFLILLVAFAFFRLGKTSSESEVKKEIINNTTFIKQIAELSSLEINGISNIRVSNKGEDSGVWEKFKNYFAENTLQVSVPYQAKYGVDMNNVNMNIQSEDSVIIIYLPECKLLSLQLNLDKISAIGKTGLFNTITIDQYIGVQKQLYEACNSNLINNQSYIQTAQLSIQSTLQKYYSPLHMKVICKFGVNNKPLLR